MSQSVKVWKVRGGIALLAVLVALVGVPWVYINVIKDDAPDALSLEPTDTSLVTSTSVVGSENDLSGEWLLATDSVVGYRVKEILFGQSTEGVGRTSDVKGLLTVENDSVVNAEFAVAMASLVSDSDRRDRQVNGRILDTATFPTAQFVLTTPIVLTPEAIAGSEFSVAATGELTLRGVTKSVNVELLARLTDGIIEVNGQIEIVFADWQIPDPSVSGISVESSGLLEFLLRFSR
jgi:polyisoprenoid-binding protein YceI